MSRVADLKFWLEGREGLKQFLWTYFERPSPLAGGAMTRLERKGTELQSLFLTEEGQARFHQALVRQASGDPAMALTLLFQAETAEGPNLRLLAAKAECQRKLQAWEGLRDSLVAAFQANPLDSRALEAAIEAQLFHREYGQILSLYKRVPRRFRSARSRLTLGVALLESGGDSAAIGVLKPLAAILSPAPPILRFALGKALSTRPAHAAEAAEWLRQFLAAAESSDPGAGTWDPFRGVERREEARRLLAELKSARSPRIQPVP